MTNLRNKGRLGMSLIEMLVYVAVLGFVVNALLGVMVMGGRLNAAGIATLDRMKNAADIRESFLRDVKTATRVADSVFSYKTTQNQLVLLLPQNRYVVYGLLRSPRRLDRLDFTIGQGQKPVPRAFTTFPLDLEGFRVDAGQNGLVSIELDADVVGNRPLPPGVKRKPPAAYRFTAATRSVRGGEPS